MNHNHKRIIHKSIPIIYTYLKKKKKNLKSRLAAPPLAEARSGPSRAVGATPAEPGRAVRATPAEPGRAFC